MKLCSVCTHNGLWLALDIQESILVPVYLGILYIVYCISKIYWFDEMNTRNCEILYQRILKDQNDDWHLEELFHPSCRVLKQNQRASELLWRHTVAKVT